MVRLQDVPYSVSVVSHSPRVPLTAPLVAQSRQAGLTQSSIPVQPPTRVRTPWVLTPAVPRHEVDDS